MENLRQKDDVVVGLRFYLEEGGHLLGEQLRLFGIVAAVGLQHALDEAGLVVAEL